MASGIAALFAPLELATFLSQRSAPTSSIVVQLFGAALFALGFLDWFTRYSPLGGIYGRPVIVTNLAFFFPAGITLVRQAAAVRSSIPLWCVAGVGLAFALGFGRLLVARPKPAAESPSGPPA